MDIKKVHGHRDAFERREVTADRPPCDIPVIVKTPHSYPMAAFRCKCNGKPLDCLHSPAIGDKRPANAKWRPSGGAEW